MCLIRSRPRSPGPITHSAFGVRRQCGSARIRGASAGRPGTGHAGSRERAGSSPQGGLLPPWRPASGAQATRVSERPSVQAGQPAVPFSCSSVVGGDGRRPRAIGWGLWHEADVLILELAHPSPPLSTSRAAIQIGAASTRTTAAARTPAAAPGPSRSACLPGPRPVPRLALIGKRRDRTDRPVSRAIELEEAGRRQRIDRSELKLVKDRCDKADGVATPAHMERERLHLFRVTEIYLDR